MTDGGSAFRPGQGEASVPVRPRSAFVAHEVFGHGDGAALVEPEVARDLRSAAEFASQEGRITGGLLYGHHWADDEGQYLVIDGFLEAGPGGKRDPGALAGGHGAAALTEAELRLMREDATRMYQAALEVGWWRSLPAPGEFSPRDFESQRELVGPGGAGLLVFGAGLDWGTAYLGPDGRVPDSARSFIPVSRPASEPSRLPAPGLSLAPVPAAEPDPEPAPEPADDLAPDPVAAAAPGASVATRRKPALTPPPAGSPVVSPVRAPTGEWNGAKAVAVEVESGMPTDVKIVVGALVLTAVLAASMVGMLVSNVLVAVIVGLVLLVGLSGFLWMSRL